MTNISIPKEKVLELIKKDNCSFYDYNNYNTTEINIIFDNYTELKEFEGASKLDLSFKDLSTLLFDRVVTLELLTITVS